MRATSLRRTGLPFLQAMTRFWYSAADFSWSLASMVEARCGAVEAALGLVDVGADDGGAHVVERQAERVRACCGLAWIAHGRAPAAGDADQAHAFHLRDLGREAVLGQVVHA